MLPAKETLRSTRKFASRAAALTLGLAAVAAYNPLQPVSPTPAPKPVTPPTQSATGVQAKAADSLVNAYGVNVHLDRPNTPYMNVSQTTALLNQLGARHVRDRVFQTSGDAAAINALHKAGIRFNMIMGRPDNAGGTPTQLINVLATKTPGATETLEGANEWNL